MNQFGTENTTEIKWGIPNEEDFGQFYTKWKHLAKKKLRNNQQQEQEQQQQQEKITSWKI